MRSSFIVAALVASVLAAGSVAAQEIKGKLVLYTSQPERDASQTVAAFKRVQPGVDVEVFRSGTTEVMGKLAAEFAGGQPRADVLLLADAATMEALKKDARLLPYREAKVDGLEAGSYDPDRTYFGSKLITMVIAVNTAAKVRQISGPISPGPNTRARSRCQPAVFGRGGDHLGTMTSRRSRLEFL
jgi:iron(III) transport system substrate-binding protein